MEPKLLIDAIVRQTTVLIAQLSTAAGIRAPLAHVADQVFVALAEEIERQGVGRKVVADMFGMALRTYQKRVERLSESASIRGQTLWESVLEYLGDGEAVPRTRIDHHFRKDSADDVAAVLNDLVTSGLVYASGRGTRAVYRALSAKERRSSADNASLDALADMAWLAIHRSGRLRFSELSVTLGVDAEATRRAVELLAARAILRSSGGDDPELEVERFIIPVEAERGWEAAVLDHFATVAGAIAAKVRLGMGARANETVGGSTFEFDLRAGHPFEQRVLGLLKRMRAEVDALWEEVSRHNRAQPNAEGESYKLWFYFGQNVQDVGLGSDHAGHAPRHQQGENET